MSPKEVLEFAKKNGVKQLDLRFTDIPGLQHHVSYPINELDESSFEEGYGATVHLPLPLQQRQGRLTGPVFPHGVGEKLQCVAALHHTGPGHGEQAGGGYLSVGALVPE